MSKPTIVHIIDSMNRGGAETLLCSVINALQPEFQQHLITLHTYNDFEQELSGDLTIHCVHHQHHALTLRTLYRLRRIISQLSPDIIHAHLYWSSLFARWASPKNIPLFYTIHGLFSADPFAKAPITKTLEQLTYNPQHHLIAVSNVVLNDYKQFIDTGKKTTVLYNSINDAFFSDYTPPLRTYTAQNPFRLVAVGNLKEAKNYTCTLQAMQQLTNLPITLDIYGEGYLRPNLQAYIDQHQLPIQLKGMHQHIEQLLPQYDAFVLSSLHEGMSLVTIEAAASGLPLLLADIPTLHEVNNNAHFFNPNHPEQLAQLLRKALENPSWLQQYISQARLNSQRYRFNNYINQLLAIYGYN